MLECDRAHWHQLGFASSYFFRIVKVFYWFCPFPLSPAVVGFLETIDGIQWDGVTVLNDGKPVILILLAPHQLVGSPDFILSGYQRLASLSQCGTILQIDRFDQSDWLCLCTEQSHDSISLGIPPSLPSPSALLALVTCSLLESNPDISDAYQDLQLMALLPGCEPDVNYIGRISLLAAAGEASSQYADLAALPSLVSELSESCLGLESQLLQRNLDLERAEVNNDQLSKQIEEERSNYAELQASFATARSSLESLLYETQRDLEESYTERKKVDEVQDGLASSLSISNSALYDTQRELEESFLEKKRQASTISELQQILQQNVARVEALNASCEADKQIITSLEAKIAALHSDLEASETAILSLRGFEAAFTESQAFVLDLQQMLQDNVTRVEALNASCEADKQIITSLEAKIAALHSDLEASETEILSLRGFEAAFTESQALLADSQGQLADLQQKWDSDNHLRDQTFAKLASDYFSLNQDLVATQGELEEHHILKIGNEARIEGLESELSEAYQNIQAIQEDIESCLAREVTKDRLIHDQHTQLKRTVALLGAAVNTPSTQGVKSNQLPRMQLLDGNDVQMHSLLIAYQACLHRAYHLMKQVPR